MYETQTGAPDSTDATAGVFLAAAFQARCADPSIHRLERLSAGIAGGASAIRATQQPDGLTWATPTYHAALLMDLSETCAGLSDAAVLAGALDDRSLARQAARYAGAMHAGIQSLWDPATHAFDWAASGSSRQRTDWRFLYPDAMEQVWTVPDGAATPSQAHVIVRELARRQPRWAAPNALARFRGAISLSAQRVGYWPAVAVALAVAGHPDSAAVASIARPAGRNGFRWPWTVEDASQLIVARAITAPGR